MSIPNKIIDYLSLGLPILTPLQGQVSNLISKESVGLCYGEICDITLSDRIFELRSHSELVFKFAKNAKKVYSTLYNFKHTYGDLVEHLEFMSQLKNG